MKEHKFCINKTELETDTMPLCIDTENSDKQEDSVSPDSL